MKIESRVTIHAGVNFVTAPFPGLDQSGSLRFQAALVDSGISIAAVTNSEQELFIARQLPMPLEIRVRAVGPQIGQLLIVAPRPDCSLEIFSEEARDVVAAFSRTWPFPQRQVLSCDATVRDLYETSAEHAFIELWEKRLGQTPDSLRIFGRGVLGGGLRFVMPPQADEPSVEVKIESYLPDTHKLYLEVQFAWQQLVMLDALDPVARIEKVDNFIRNEVVKFIVEGQKE